MANETQLNRSIRNESQATVLNNNLGTNETVLNTQIAYNNKIEIGTVLLDRYEVIGKLDVTTGEADLYLCSFEENNYVAKVYRRKIAIKLEIMQKLKAIDSPYVAKVYDAGEINGFPIEILPYYKYGSLQGKKFTYEELKENIIPALNEGLRVLHENEIIHKDLKPSNIMLTDDCKTVAIIDFGISSVREDGNTVVVTKTGMTPEYSAPETFKNLFLNESDYYSLGITVFELFYGYTPYSSMDKQSIEQYISVQHIPYPSDVPIPEQLKNFIRATTYYDITNRNNKANPNRRWGYEEVKNWCAGIEQTIPGEGMGNISGDMKPYTFLGKKYAKKAELVRAMAENWEDGKKQLFRGLLSGFFKSFDPEIAGFCIDAEEEATRVSGKEDVIFWETMYKLNRTREFYWKGKVYQGLPVLGKDLLEHLWKEDNSLNQYVDEILAEGLLSKYIKLISPKSEKLIMVAAGLESAHRTFGNNIREKQKNYYMMAYILSGQKIFYMDRRYFKAIEELTSYMKELLQESYEEFEEFCHKLIDYNDNLDIQFESWLLVLGKKKELEQWRNDLEIFI